MKKALTLILALLFLAPACISGETLIPNKGEMTLSLNAYQDLSKPTLSALQNMFSHMRLLFDLTGEEQKLALLFDTETLLSIQRDPSGLLIAPPGIRYAGKSPVSVAEIPDGLLFALNALPVTRAALSALDQTDALFADRARDEKQGLNLKGIGQGTRKLACALSPEDMEAQWPRLVAAFSESLLKENVSERVSERILGFLKSLSFPKKCVFRTVLNSDGQPIGRQFSGAAVWKDEKRSVSWTLGRTEQAGLTLRFSAAKAGGKTRTELEGSYLKREGNKLDFSLLDKNGKAKQRITLTGHANLQNGIEGTLRLTLDTAQKTAVTYVIEPNLKDGQGSLKLSRLRGNETLYSLTLGAAPLTHALPRLNQERSVALETLSEEGRAEELRALGHQLAALFMKLTKLVQPEDPDLFLHDLGRTFKTEGESLSPHLLNDQKPQEEQNE